MLTFEKVMEIFKDTFIQNGDSMCDPEMTFRVDHDKGTLEGLFPMKRLVDMLLAFF